MANQGWPNDGGAGVQTSSTARQSGRGTQDGDFDGFAHGVTDAHPVGGDSDPLSSVGDRMEPAGQLATTPEI
jgi:hypothetical protein